MVSLRSITKRGAWCFGLAILATLSLGFWFLNDASAVCNSQGYCYGTGSNPRGGKCGDESVTGVWWDTCFGLSWQYYDWPTGYTGDISFPGSTNAGYATVSSQCSEYGGFWFLGYEAYIPSTHESLGYQVGAPRVGMLAAYDSTNGYTNLYSAGEPQPNPSIRLNTSSGTIKLRGSRYANEAAMTDTIERLFNNYSLGLDPDGMPLISGSGNGSSGTTFADINWFCARETPPPPLETAEVSGLVEVVYNNRNESAGWNNSNKANIYITINEGETAEIKFNDHMASNGKQPVIQSYSIWGDFVNGTESGTLIAPINDNSTHTVGTHTGTVSTAGEYCEFLQFERNGLIRTMQSCATVRVVPNPPEIYGRVGVEATIYDENGDVKATVPLSETSWNDSSNPPLTVPIHLGNSDTVSIRFVDSMKGEGSNAADMDYAVTNSALAGVKTESTFKYGGGSDEGVQTMVKETILNNDRVVNQRGLICETLSFGADENNHSVVACVNITKDDDPDLDTGTSDNVGDGFNFNVDVDLKLTVSIDNKLVKDAGINGAFLRDYTTLNVSSNSHNGYVALLTTDKNSTNENATNLVHDYKDSVIRTLDYPVTRGDFPAGQWGYSLDDTFEGDDDSTYGPLVAMNSIYPIVVIDATEPSSNKQDVYFGAKMDVSNPTGTYSNSVVFKVVTRMSAPAPTTIDNTEYMQDINDDVLASMVVGQQYKLKDKRDEKEYWVTKFKNNYVMMTQNLAYELRYGDVLSSDTTDIGYGNIMGGYKSGRSYWFVSHTTETDMTNPFVDKEYKWSANGDEDPCYVDNCGGSYDYNMLGERSKFNVSPAAYYVNCLAGSHDESSVYCSQISYYIDDSDCAAATGLTEDECSHARSGVLYNESAAMAGGDHLVPAYTYGDSYNRFQDRVMTDSVCPKGWRLPTYGESEIIRYGMGLSAYEPFYFNIFWLARSYSYPYYISASVNTDGSTSMSMSSSSAYSGYRYPVRCIARYGMNEEVNRER